MAIKDNLFKTYIGKKVVIRLTVLEDAIQAFNDMEI